MLTGKAKTDYQREYMREYMRRRRAAAAKPVAPSAAATKPAPPDAAKAAKKPPLPPDEARDRQIKALKTRVQNLEQELALWYRTANKRPKIIMTKQLYRHIRACLHPDRAPKGQEKLWTERAQDFNELPATLSDRAS